jgi:hypothetical protein
MLKPPTMHVEEVDGQKSDPAARTEALQSVALDFAQSIQRLLADGWLINDNGRIIPNPERVEKTAEGWRIISDTERTTADAHQESAGKTFPW